MEQSKATRALVSKRVWLVAYSRHGEITHLSPIDADALCLPCGFVFLHAEHEGRSKRVIGPEKIN